MPIMHELHIACMHRTIGGLYTTVMDSKVPNMYTIAECILGHLCSKTIVAYTYITVINGNV